MKIQLLRHATLFVTINGKKIVVDPMLGTAGGMPPFANSLRQQRNPLVELGIKINFQQDVDGVLLTHTHSDHFDEAAIAQIPSSMPILCQPADEEKLKGLGFTRIYAISENLSWQGITIIRTGGQHGTGEIAVKMGTVSGYLLQAEDEPSLYIAGDTIYCEEVEKVLTQHQPQVIVLNAGGARFDIGDPITMTAEDVAMVCKKGPQSQVIAVHMDAINHCVVSREYLRDYLTGEGLLKQVLIPLDGEEVTLT